MLSQKARDDKKLLDLDSLFEDLRQKEHLHNQFEKINLAREKKNREGREDREDERDENNENNSIDNNNRDEERDERGKEDRENREDDDNVAKSEKDSQSSESEFNNNCKNYEKNHINKSYSHANMKCTNCETVDYKWKLCFTFSKEDNSNSNEEDKSRDDFIDMLKELREIEEIDALSTSNITSLFKFIDLIQTTINCLAASIKDVVWIFDFDATKHVSDNRNLFTNFTLDDSQIVQTASDKNLTIEKTKDVIISLSNQSILILIDVLFMSDLIVNLISTPRLWHKRIIVSFSSMKLASLRYDSQLVVHADNVNDQFLLRNEVVLAMHMHDSQSCFKMSKKTTDIKIWHRRLVHLRYRNVVANAKKVANMKEVHDSFSKKLCETCLKAKQQSESTRHLMSKTTEFLNEIHVNIEDSLSLTFRDHRFFLLIKNDVFDMFFVYILKTKEKIFARLKKFRI